MKKLMTVLAAAGILLTGSAFAQSGSSRMPDTATVNFVTQAAKGGMTEVNTGRLALKSAKNPGIKAFASRMITDHSKANAELMGIVKTKGWNIQPPPATETAPDAMLTGVKGSEFDKAYVTMMVQDHKKTVALFQHAASSSPDPSIRAYASRTLPVLKQHLVSIQSIAGKTGIR